MTDEYQAMTLQALIRTRVAIDVELGRRGISRTSGPVVGELAERLALEIYGGVLATPGLAAVDLVMDDGSRVQVKARALPRGDQRFFSFKSLDFDIALCVRFDRATYAVDWAREFTADEIRLLAHEQGAEWRLRTAAAAKAGLDRRSEAVAAYEVLNELDPR